MRPVRRLGSNTPSHVCASERAGRQMLNRAPLVNDRGAQGNHMASKHALLIELFAAALIAVACTIGQAPPPIDPVAAAGTIVAETLAAQGITLAPGAVSTEETPSAEPPTATPTVKPGLKITVNGTECRAGIGADADVIATFGANTDVDLIARDSADGYWLVKDPASGSSCWVSAQNATPSGGFTQLPEITPQVPAASNAPAAPAWAAVSNAWQYNCVPGLMTVSLQWTDRADNEQGYRVYRNGELLIELPAGSTSYSDQVNTAGGTFSYTVSAYNAVGESGPLGTGSFSC